MNSKKWAAGIAAGFVFILLTAGVSAETGNSGGGIMGGARDFMRGAESAVEDILPGENGTAGDTGTLGDTSDGTAGTTGDGAIDGTADDGIGTADGFLGDESDLAADSGAAGGSDTSGEATDTAQTSSGNETQNRGMSVFGIILTIVIIGAVVALLFALMPKRRNT